MFRSDVLLVGNPNVGKTAIFNFLTGASQKVANFPGITVSGKRGECKVGTLSLTVMDLPGIYGFGPASPEELVPREILLEGDYKVIINVVDGTKLERNLFLTYQLAMMSKNMMVVITFSDKMKEEGIIVNKKKMEELLGIPVLVVDSFNKLDLEHLKTAILKQVQQPRIPRPVLLTELKQDRIFQEAVSKIIGTRRGFSRNELSTLAEEALVYFIALKDDYVWSQFQSDLRNAIEGVIDEIERKYALSSGLDIWLIEKEYELIEQTQKQLIVRGEGKKKQGISEKIDRVLLHPFWGMIIFIGVMWLMFQLIFVVSQPASDLLDFLFSKLAEGVRRNAPFPILASFIADGLINGVGFVLIFVPQIALLFIGLTIMEQSGYLARVVFITDRFMAKIGLSGKSIAPLILGFGCNVSGVLSTKSITDRKERITTILANPFIPCSARFPVFVMLSASFFPKNAGSVLTLVYFAGIAMAILVSWLLRNTLTRGEESSLLLEMPDLVIPSLRTISYQTYLYLREFVEHAASWIAAGVIGIWILSVTGPKGFLGSEAMSDPELMQKSWVFFFGRLVLPIFSPLGWNTELVVALIFGFVAKEIVISTLGLLYGSRGEEPLLVALGNSVTPVSGLAYMFFTLMYTPCIATVIAIKNEIGGKWAIFSVLAGLLIGWMIAFIIVFVGGLF